MKGQAFVGLPSEQSAEKALRETNGYVFYDKPLVVVSFYPLFASRNKDKDFIRCGAPGYMSICLGSITWCVEEDTCSGTVFLIKSY